MKRKSSSDKIPKLTSPKSLPTEKREPHGCVSLHNWVNRTCSRCGAIKPKERAIQNFLEAVRDPGHEEHDAKLEWVGGSFDAEAFDLAAVNRALVAVPKAGWSVQ
jgi:hypothetical protein